MGQPRRQPVPAWVFILSLATTLALRWVPTATGQAPPAPPTTATATNPAPALILKHDPPPDAAWTSDAEVVDAHALTLEGLGAGQGVCVREGKVYAYGDLYSAEPRVGIVREYDLTLKATGRSVHLSRDGVPLIIHPTGLTWDPLWGTFLGDTVRKKAVIYRLDWEKAWQDGNLDHAVLNAIDDDAAVNGCRPTFVRVRGRDFLASADYGDVRPEIRLYDPAALLEAGRTSFPGVTVHRVLCGPFNQNLYWDASARRLTCVQNVVEGRGWRLEVLDLERAVNEGRVSSADVHRGTMTFLPHDELEGYWPLDERQALMLTSSRRENLLVGKLRPMTPRTSPPAAIGDKPGN